MSRRALPRAAEGLAAIGATAVVLAVLAVLVVAGALSAIDEYAVDHWMPDFEPSTEGSSSFHLAHQFYPHLGDSALHVVSNVWSFPASAFVSGLILVACCVVLVRRGQRLAALAWVVAWVAATAVEVIGKEVLHRPVLHAMEAGVRVSFDSFGHSFPSGHALRGVVTASLAVSVWTRAAWPAVVWVIGTLVALVVSASHTPTDVLGGALLGVLAVLSVLTLLGTRARVAAA